MEHIDFESRIKSISDEELNDLYFNKRDNYMPTASRIIEEEYKRRKDYSNNFRITPSEIIEDNQI